MEVDTPDGDRLDLLLVLVSAYEDERVQIGAPDPRDREDGAMPTANDPGGEQMATKGLAKP